MSGRFPLYKTSYMSNSLANIEQKRFANTIILTTIEEWVYLELFTKLLRKGDVACIVETSLAEDQNSILVLECNKL